MAELPSQCHVCGLSLVASQHLARSYHHLFPVNPFGEVAKEELEGATVRRADGLPLGSAWLEVGSAGRRRQCNGCPV